MASESGTTHLAIVAGAVLGAVAALFAAKPKAPSPRSIAVTSAPPAETPTRVTAPPPAPSADVWNADEDDPEAVDASVDPNTAELDCARGVPRMCLLAAAAERKLDAGRVRLFQHLAVSHWNQACTARDPQACHELAKLHERGIGVPVSAEHAKALRQRAVDLCAQKSTAFCDTL